MLTFDWPFIFLLLPLPWLVYKFMPPARRVSPALRVPFFAKLPLADAPTLRQAISWHLLLLTAIWLLLVVAAARPIWVGEQVQLPSSGRNLMLAVDISGSMQVEDMQLNNAPVNRLAVVKQVVGNFVQQRGGDRLGLILFGTQAYLQTPLTFDRFSVQTQLSEAQIGFAGEKTAIGDAVGLAIKRLQGNSEQSRILILLTDGANTAGEVSPQKAAELAAQARVKIYTIGMGADEMVVPGIFGSSFGSRRTNPSADLDEKTLNLIAEKTGGQYFRARDPEELASIYAELDRLEPVDQDQAFYRPRKALFYVPLALVLCLVGCWTLLHMLSLRAGPQAQPLGKS